MHHEQAALQFIRADVATRHGLIQVLGALQTCGGSMKRTLSMFLIIFVASFPALPQSAKNYRVLVEVTDNGTTSELHNTPMTANPSDSRALLSIKYFGPTSESDISVVLTLHGAKSR